MRCLGWGALPVGGLLGGVFGQWFGARTALWIGAIGACLAFLPVCLSPLRTMRELPTRPDDEPSPDDGPSPDDTLAPATHG